MTAGSKGNSIDHGFCKLYNEIRKAVETARLKETKAGCVYIMIDDLSLLEIAANGSENDVLNFLHYCATLTSEVVNSTPPYFVYLILVLPYDTLSAHFLFVISGLFIDNTKP
jgi:hypothetical protein